MKFAQIAIALAVAFSLTVGSAGVALAGDYDEGPEKPKKEKPKKEKPKKEKPKKEKPKKEKVQICHVPPGNPGNAHVIEVPKKAFEKGHEKHGDFKSTHKECKEFAEKHEKKKHKKKKHKKKKHKRH